MCETETEAKDELVEIFKNMTEKDWKNLIEELENAINSEKRTSSSKKPQTIKPAQNTTNTNTNWKRLRLTD